ncbi:hypothetical protein [Leptodesmis sichuanensis]|uniref:hypothetical protein n=1 Tax=Leptodesmis sichuanensis TaxID=2906798 RepID=UPI001F436004|nr:hypothetical protein [Leptodesmis sichuanensis]UIE39062.1 hypothetical protein KIK02_05560 [Leptodesmis sichuanensis A121]
MNSTAADPRTRNQQAGQASQHSFPVRESQYVHDRPLRRDRVDKATGRSQSHNEDHL